MALIAGDIHINLHTKENSTALTKIVMRLFDLWQIPIDCRLPGTNGSNNPARPVKVNIVPMIHSMMD